MGKTLGTENGIQRIVSSPCNALLYFENLQESNSEIEIYSIRDGLERFEIKNTNVLGIEENQTNTFRTIDPTSGDFLFLDLPKEWKTLSSALQGAKCPIIVVCGSRKVGKSTLVRYLVNSLLDKYPKVAHIDLDCGQTEFAPPGFLTLKVVSEPLLGPPLRHSGDGEETRYLGFMAADKGVRWYYESGTSLISVYFKNYHKEGLPLVVNTMGWVTGLGFSLLQGFLQFTRPSHIIAIKGESPSMDRTIPEYVHEALYEEPELKFIKTHPLLSGDDVSIATVATTQNQGGRIRWNPPELRDMMWLTYFLKDRITCRYSFPRSLTELVPLTVPWKKIQIVVPAIGSPKYIYRDSFLFTLNQSIVGLAPHLHARSIFRIKGLKVFKYEDASEIPHCHGAALIRSVDPIDETFEILTPLPLTDLVENQLYTFILEPGFILSASIQLEAQTSFGEAPYMNPTGILRVSAPLIRRVRSNIKRKWTS